MESLEDVKVQVHTYDAEMGRTGGGVFNTTLKSGTNSFRGTAFFQTRPLWGQANNYFSRARRAGEARQRVLPRRRRRRRADRPNKTFFWFATENYHDIQSRSVSDGVSDGGRAARRLLAAHQRGRAAGHHLRPADRAAVPGQPHPAEPDQPGRGVDRRLPPAAGRRCRQRHQQLHAHGRDQQQVPAVYSDQGRAQVHRQGLADRLLPLQPHRRAGRQLLRGRAQRRHPLRRSQRLPPEAAAADPGHQQHLGAGRQLGAGAALRLDAISSTTRTMTIDFDPATLGILAVVPRPRRPDRRAEVSERLDLRLQQLRRDHALVPHLQLVEHERRLFEARRPPHVQGRRRLPSRLASTC